MRLVSKKYSVFTFTQTAFSRRIDYFFSMARCVLCCAFNEERMEQIIEGKLRFSRLNKY